MNNKLSYLHGMPAHATDGGIGSINDFLFDLRSGRIVHIVINTTGHMFGKYVVVAPEVCIIDGNICRIDLFKETIMQAPVPVFDSSTFLPDRDLVRGGFTVEPRYFGGTAPVSFPAEAALPDWKRNKPDEGARLHVRSIREIALYGIADKYNPERPAQCIDAVVNDSPWSISRLLTAYGTSGEHCGKVRIADVEAYDHTESVIRLRDSTGKASSLKSTEKFA